MTTSVSPSDRIKSLKRTSPSFTTHDICNCHRLPPAGSGERANAVYAVREITD